MSNNVEEGVASSTPQDSKPKKSLFAAVKEKVATVFASNAPKSDEDGNLKHLHKPKIAESTRKQRDRALLLWDDYMKECHAGVNADNVWVDLCRGCPVAIQHCCTFLEVHVEVAKVTRVVLDEREEVEEQAIKSARSLNTFWKTLIAAADAEILLRKREASPSNHWMMLKRPTDKPGSLDEGPVAVISHWIYNEGADKMGLSTKPKYKKVEFTVADIGLNLKTLWLRADLVHFVQPIQRVFFHALVLLFSLGFHQGMIIGMKYQDVTVAVLRDEDNRRRLVTTFNINRNKLRANAHEHTKGESFEFTTTLLPYALFCLTHLVCVVGIYFDAFEAGYQSIDDLLNTPNLETVDYVHLQWKKDKLDAPIFPMSYTWFWRTLRRVLLVAGFNTLVRIYAFRLGALMEYDGSLTSAVRNFIASHTTKMFENNYETKHVREDLARHHFGAAAGGEANEPLFAAMRDLSKQSDPGAPIEASAEQKRSIESRRDINRMQKELEAAQNARPRIQARIAKAKATINQWRRTLYDLLVLDARAKYFAAANALRSAGDSIEELRDKSRPAKRDCDHAMVNVGGLMELWTGETGFSNRNRKSAKELVFHVEAEGRSEKAMNWLVSYVRQAWSRLRPSHIVPMSEGSVPTTDATFAKKPRAKRTKETNKQQQEEGGNAEKTPRERERKWKCLLCDAKPYKDRSSLTRHTKDNHIARGTFEQSFPCPQCVRDGQVCPAVISGAVIWSDHTERMHHKFCSPFITEEGLRGSGIAPKMPRQRKTPAAGAKPAKRKRERLAEELAPYTGVFVPDSSKLETEESLSKKARTMGPVPEYATCPSLTSSASSDMGGASGILSLDLLSVGSNTPPASCLACSYRQLGRLHRPPSAR
ncbi:hypothetical protein MMC29_004978 [Sticta canariensis]|nr:hypothetical protein [Sticta canariensis]